MASFADPMVPARVGAAFRLLMQLRTLTAMVTLVLILPAHPPTAVVLLLSFAALSWIAARHWQLIVPRLLLHPLLVAADVAASFTALRLGGPTGPFFLSTVITAGVAGLLFRWPGMLAISAIQVFWYYLTLAGGHVPAADQTFQALAGQPLYYPLIGFAGVALRKLIDDQAEAESTAAAAEERTWLAREMHDSLAKTLRGIAMATAALPMWAHQDPDRAVKESVRIAADVEVASREARNLINGLRDERITMPLPMAVRAIAESWRDAHGISVRCDIDSGADLPLRARYEAVAICSEALTNVVRHAAATSVDVRLAAERGGVVLTIRDDGEGFELRSLEDLARDGHYGLLGLRERAERAGGAVSLRSEPKAGTTVTVTFPVAGASPGGLRVAEVI
ncbi:sensor histidine kinase [Actinoallomurus sp. CA-150999]|uniref:sensor histidine kinase n=1 Tax=Actinoallomurus sp. CA-150999 TaxID=3239887 RepID=UPI003D906BB0